MAHEADPGAAEQAPRGPEAGGRGGRRRAAAPGRRRSGDGHGAPETRPRPSPSRGRPAALPPSATSTSRWPSARRPTSRTTASGWRRRSRRGGPRRRRGRERAPPGARPHRHPPSTTPATEDDGQRPARSATPTGAARRARARGSRRTRPTASLSTRRARGDVADEDRGRRVGRHDPRRLPARLPRDGDRPGPARVVVARAPRPWPRRSPILQAPRRRRERTTEEIKKAHRRLVRHYRPDRNPGDEAAEERFKEIQAAYDVLGDADKRKQYDRGTGPFAGARDRAFSQADFGGFSDILSNLFGQAAGSLRAGGVAAAG